MLEKETLEKAILAELGRVARRRAKREAEIEEGKHAEQYRQMGELILGNRGQIERGSTQIAVADWFGRGEEVTIPLRPDLGPVENAQRYFRRWKKASKAGQILLLLLRRDGEEEEWLSALQGKVAAVETPEEVASLAEALVKRGYRSQRLVRKVGSPVKVSRRPKGVKVYEDFAGFRVLVGTGAQGNETILRELSSPDDIWLHTRGARGAHAIIKTNRQPDRVSLEAIQKVAALAAYFSDERGAGTVAVDYTLRKYVRKVKGGNPGMARYERGKTVLVKPLDRPPTAALPGLSAQSPAEEEAPH